MILFIASLLRVIYQSKIIYPKIYQFMKSPTIYMGYLLNSPSFSISDFGNILNYIRNIRS